MAEQTIWTDQELAEAWKVDLRLVQKMCRDGRIPAFKAGRDWRITDRAKRAHEDATAQQRQGSAA